MPCAGDKLDAAAIEIQQLPRQAYLEERFMLAVLLKASHCVHWSSLPIIVQAAGRYHSPAHGCEMSASKT